MSSCWFCHAAAQIKTTPKRFYLIKLAIIFATLEDMCSQIPRISYEDELCVVCLRKSYMRHMLSSDYFVRKTKFEIYMQAQPFDIEPLT